MMSGIITKIRAIGVLGVLLLMTSCGGTSDSNSIAENSPTDNNGTNTSIKTIAKWGISKFDDGSLYDN